MVFSRRNMTLLIVGWVIAMAIALPNDRAAAQWVLHHHPLQLHPRLIWFMRLPGRYPFLIPIGVLLGLLHPKKWGAAAPLLLTGPPVGLVYTVLKWCFGRVRPVKVIAPFALHPFIGGIRGLFVAVPGLSFPSGDAMMAAAAATAMTIVLPRWAAAFWAWAVVVCAERVLENAHYLSDVVTGSAGGVVCAWIACWFANCVFGPKPEQTGFEPIVIPSTRT
jgi:membrane-associated phospholipid phosphatase